MTTAFFGIRAVSNTAQSAVAGAGEQAVAMSQSALGSARPAVTDIEPDTGALAGNEDVTIRGSGFIRDAIVRFGSTSALSVFVSTTEIKAKSPAGTPGQIDVTVETLGGISDIGPSTKFTYQ
jgi:hypothetical protein